MVNPFSSDFSVDFGGGPAANIYPNVIAWAGSTSYSVGQTRQNGTNAYRVITPGTSASSGGPTGTGSNITDGTVHWKYLSAVDYTSVQDWVNAVVAASPLSQDYTGWLWNTGSTITPVAGTAVADFTGANSNGHTITLTCASGESFRDALLANSALPLAYNASNGVAIQLPATGSGLINYINCTTNNIVIDGIQYQDPNTSSVCTLIGGTGNNCVIRNCILDGQTQAGGATVVQFNGTGLTMYNNLVIDHDTALNGGTVQALGTGANISANIFILPAALAGAACLDAGTNSTVSSDTAKNNIYIGYSLLVVNGSGGNIWTTSNNAATAASFAAGNCGTDTGGSQYGLTASNLFVNASTNFRTKSGASIIGGGANLATLIPTLDDIIGDPRPPSGAWDNGAYETVTAVSVSVSGVVCTTHVGSLVANPGIGITGVSATSHVGTLTTKTDDSISLTGVASTLSVGTLIANPSIGVTGVLATSHIGSLSEEVDDSVSLIGVSSTGSVGSLTASSSDSAGLTGVLTYGVVGVTGFSRNSIGTYIWSDGTMQVAGPNQIRYNWDVAPPHSLLGLLIEPSSVNSLNNSNNPNITNHPAGTVTPSTDIAPLYSGATVFKHTITTGGDNNMGALGVLVPVSGQPYAGAVYVYIPSAFVGTYVHVAYEGGGLAGSTTGAADLTKVDQWQRVLFVKSSASSTSNSNIVLRMSVSTMPQTIYSTCWQHEQNQTTSTSYIPNSGTSASRAADVANINFTEIDYGLTGVASTTDIGDLVIPTNDSVNITGVSATSHIGTLTTETDDSTSLGGVLTTSHVGTLTTETDDSASLTGVSSTTYVGSLIAATAITLAHVQATGAVGLLTTETDDTTSLLGVAATGLIGTLSTETDDTASLTGVAVVGSVGPLAVFEGIPLVGVSSAVSVGLLGADTQSSLLGLASALSVGSLATEVDVPLPGVSAAGSVGLLATRTDDSVSLGGVATTGSVGSLIGDPGAPLTGVSATGEVGSFAYEVDAPLAGLLATGQVGVLSTSQGILVPITHISAVGAVGSFGISTTGSIPGLLATGSVYALTPDPAAVVHGVAATGHVGTLALRLSFTLPAVSSVGHVGALAISTGQSAQLTSVASIGTVGSLEVTYSSQTSLTGLHAAGTVAGLSREVAAPLSSVAAAGTVSALALEVDTFLAGLMATGHLGDLARTVAIALPGVASMAGVGNLTGAHAQFITGLSATGHIAPLDDQEVMVGLAGVVSDTAVGSLSQLMVSIGPIISTTAVGDLTTSNLIIEGVKATATIGALYVSVTTSCPLVFNPFGPGNYALPSYDTESPGTLDGAAGYAIPWIGEVYSGPRGCGSKEE